MGVQGQRGKRAKSLSENRDCLSSSLGRLFPQCLFHSSICEVSTFQIDPGNNVPISPVPFPFPGHTWYSGLLAAPIGFGLSFHGDRDEVGVLRGVAALPKEKKAL